jgi:hypothetical protein
MGHAPFLAPTHPPRAIGNHWGKNCPDERTESPSPINSRRLLPTESTSQRLAGHTDDTECTQRSVQTLSRMAKGIALVHFPNALVVVPLRRIRQATSLLGASGCQVVRRRGESSGRV